MDFIVDWNDFERRMRARGEDFRKAMFDATKEVTLFAHSQLPSVPPPSHKPFEFVSIRQAIFVRAAIREGLIQVPYRRSNTMMRSITTKVLEEGDSIIGILGTNESYAPWVISNERVGSRGPQASYHRGTWFILQEFIRDLQGPILDLFKKMLFTKLD